jgi:hypothetical protein
MEMKSRKRILDFQHGRLAQYRLPDLTVSVFSAKKPYVNPIGAELGNMTIGDHEMHRPRITVRWLGIDAIKESGAGRQAL